MFNVSKFIAEIQCRPGLYNTELSDLNAREVMWEEVAEALYENWNEMESYRRKKLKMDLKTRWKSMVEHFKRQVKLKGRQNKNKKYMYFDQLLFLIPIIQKQMNRSHCKKQRNADRQRFSSKSDEKMCRKFSKDSLWIKNGSTQKSDRGSCEISKSSDSFDLQDVNTKISDENENKMGNRDFLMSLLPILNKVPQHLNLKIRMKIMQALQEDFESVVICDNIVEYSCTDTDLSDSISDQR